MIASECNNRAGARLKLKPQFVRLCECRFGRKQRAALTNPIRVEEHVVSRTMLKSQPG